MKTQSKTVLASNFAGVMAAAAASAQQAPPPPPTTPYGAPIGFEAAKRVMAAAEVEAIKNNGGMAIAILDSAGQSPHTVSAPPRSRFSAFLTIPSSCYSH
jgi:glc operon protein GlcG